MNGKLLYSQAMNFSKALQAGNPVVIKNVRMVYYDECKSIMENNGPKKADVIHNTANFRAMYYRITDILSGQVQSAAPIESARQTSFREAINAPMKWQDGNGLIPFYPREFENFVHSHEFGKAEMEIFLAAGEGQGRAREFMAQYHARFRVLSKHIDVVIRADPQIDRTQEFHLLSHTVAALSEVLVYHFSSRPETPEIAARADDIIKSIS